MPRTVEDHLFGPGPKRLLALDGGGIKGMLTLSFLGKIERTLRDRHADDGLLLGDYFDLIGGTSTGAIIAAGLARGYSVAEIQKLYVNLGEQVFRKSWLRRGLIFAKYRSGPLRRALDEHFGFNMDDERLRTGLMVVSKRWDTGSPWVIHNNPRGRYWEDGETHRGNRHYGLAQVVRASTAAPTFFSPEFIQIAEAKGRLAGQRGRFVDGGVTPHNNPALQMLLMAVLEGFGLGWPLGAEKLLMISVGTGAVDPRQKAPRLLGRFPIYDGITSLAALMADCDALVQTVLQSTSASDTAWDIDSEIADARASSGTTKGSPDARLLTYQRYDVKYTSRWLAANLDLQISEKQAKRLGKMDLAANLPELAKIGDLAAAKQVLPRHFPPSFDLTALNGPPENRRTEGGAG